ncbi:MraY family glycosyltransferase [Polaribacter sp.]|uniref:glycosyltransferase family 4 protein n=1 Tax=Polaribacter sp. TaxID=1920175 RepID=UPI0025F3AB0A|nr:MraY family glycosyltransferase [Polaribacter sp.]
MPKIRTLSLHRGFVAIPEERSSHTSITPSFGGVSFYIALLVFFALVFSQENILLLGTLFFSVSVIFFTGLKDDLKDISPKAKLLGQCIAIGALLFHSEFRITDLHGFLGVTALPTFVSVLFSTFLYVSLMNAYNLIDGIDGLASIIGIVVASSFGVLFFSIGLYFYVGLCVVIVGMLLAFLRFNFSSKRKLFMGDTGSLILGLLFGVLTMRLLSVGFSTVSALGISRSYLPVLALAILSIPAFDIVRVVCIRKIHKKPFFSPDRNHLHHVLIDSGLSHAKTSLLAGGINIWLITVVYNALLQYGLITGIVVLFAGYFVLTVSLFVLNRRLGPKRMKVKLRRFLFKITYPTPNVTAEKQLIFNKKLKLIRIFFF